MHLAAAARRVVTVIPSPSRAHVLMRLNRTDLIARYFLLMPGLPEIGRRAVCDYWTREKIADHIITIEREEALTT